MGRRLKVPDYHAKIRALRAKAHDPVVTAEERIALLEKAAELEEKYGKPSSPFTYDTTVTGRDGRYYGYRAETVPPTREAWNAVWDLFLRQSQWNKPYEEANID